MAEYDPKFVEGEIYFDEKTVQHLKDNPERMEYIRNGGYASPEAFLDDVINNFDAIYENTQKNGEKRLLISRGKKHAASLDLEIKPDGKGGYKVVTVFPTNARYLKNRKQIWERSDTLSTKGSIKDAQARSVLNNHNTSDFGFKPPLEGNTQTARKHIYEETTGEPC